MRLIGRAGAHGAREDEGHLVVIVLAGVRDNDQRLRPLVLVRPAAAAAASSVLGPFGAATVTLRIVQPKLLRYERTKSSMVDSDTRILWQTLTNKRLACW